jgi:nucleotide-binding universal stress UspA family protein
VVVALDASPQSLAALRTAAQLAAQLHAELHGLFVEDADLLRLCNLPFGQEIGLVSALARRLESRDLERQFRGLAASLQQAMARVAEPLRVPWSFAVTRGRVTDELLAAAQSAQLLSLGAYQRAPGSPVAAAAEAVLRQTPRPVLILGAEGRLVRAFTLVYTASEQAERALNLAIRLAQRTDQPLQVILPMQGGDAEEVQARLGAVLLAQGIPFRIVAGLDATTFMRQVQNATPGLLILPAEHTDLLARRKGSVIVVP